MKKDWVEVLDYLAPAIDDEICDLDINNPYFKEFQWALFQGLKKEYDNANIPVLDDPIIFSMEIKQMLKGIKIGINHIYVLTDGQSIYGIVIMKTAKGFFTKTALTFPLTALTSKADKKDIFKIIEKCKELIDYLYHQVDYIMLETVLTNKEVIAHNKHILNWFENKYGKTTKAYEIFTYKPTI